MNSDTPRTALDAYLTQYPPRFGEGRRLAKICGVDPSAVSHWRAGKRRPNLMRAMLLERATGGAVPVASWLRPAGVSRVLATTAPPWLYGRPANTNAIAETDDGDNGSRAA